MLRETLHYLAGSSKLKRTAAVNPVARRLAARFVAGERLEQALAAVRTVNGAGMSVTMDHLGENVTSEEEARAATEDYKRALQAIADNKLDANVSCKLTHLGLNLSEALGREQVTNLITLAASLGIFVRIDMEDARYTQVTLDTTREIFSQHENVGTVIQSYLYRSEDDVKTLNALKIRCRLVKGAYLEPPSVAFPQKADVDENYRRLAELLLRDGGYPAFGTHDEAIIGWIKAKADALGRGKDSFEFQMLYGIRRDLQRSLTAEGYRFRVYMPYGSEWYPYLMRRLAERPANLMFMVGSVAREAGVR